MPGGNIGGFSFLNNDNGLLAFARLVVRIVDQRRAGETTVRYAGDRDTILARRNRRVEPVRQGA
jgi:hypothetical protein